MLFLNKHYKESKLIYFDEKYSFRRKIKLNIQNNDFLINNVEESVNNFVFFEIVLKGMINDYVWKQEYSNKTIT